MLGSVFPNYSDLETHSASTFGRCEEANYSSVADGPGNAGAEGE